MLRQGVDRQELDQVKPSARASDQKWMLVLVLLLGLLLPAPATADLAEEYKLYLERAREQVANRSFRAALASSWDAINHGERPWEAYGIRARAQLELGELTEAKESVQQALELAPIEQRPALEVLAQTIRAKLGERPVVAESPGLPAGRGLKIARTWEVYALEGGARLITLVDRSASRHSWTVEALSKDFGVFKGFLRQPNELAYLPLGEQRGLEKIVDQACARVRTWKSPVTATWSQLRSEVGASGSDQLLGDDRATSWVSSVRIPAAGNGVEPVAFAVNCKAAEGRRFRLAQQRAALDFAMHWASPLLKKNGTSGGRDLQRELVLKATRTALFQIDGVLRWLDTREPASILTSEGITQYREALRQAGVRLVDELKSGVWLIQKETGRAPAAGKVDAARGFFSEQDLKAIREKFF